MTMTADHADWPQIDSAAVTSSSDLFGGDLFGDELMDMYNSAAVVESGSTDVIESITEIPHLLPASNEEQSANKVCHSTTIDHSHPGAQVAMAAAAMDDGLGAFRPSTSFNDFGSLLPAEETEQQTQQQVAAAPVVSAASVNAPSGPPPSKAEAAKPKKRGRTNSGAAAGKEGGAAAPSPKKRKSGAAGGAAGGNRRGGARAAGGNATKTAEASTAVHPVSPTTAKTVTSGQAPAKKGAKAAAGGNKNTPNPLALPSLSNVVVGGSSKVALAPTVVTPKSGIAAATAAIAAVAKAPAAAARQVVVPPKGAVATAAAAAAAAVKAASHPTPTPATSSAMNPASIAVAKAAAAKGAPAPAAAPVPAPVPAAVPSSSAAASQTAAGVAPKTETTEDDFKGVAQAAVNNLIISVGSKTSQPNQAQASASKGTGSCPSSVMSSSASALDPNKKVDTSSAHIAALTSSNWVAACSEGIGDAPPGSQQAAQAAALAAAAAASDPAISKAARARRANLTPDERARQNRDRNREHARNTRLRKKAYVEELKKTLTELVAQRDASELERRHEAQRDLEVREVRFRVMEEFLKLRSQGGNASLLSRWVAIMEEGFTLTLPRTEYRAMANQQRSGGLPRAVSIDHTSAAAAAASASEQVLKGASEVMADAANLAAFVNTFGSSNVVGGAATAVRFTHCCDRKKFMMDGVNAMLEWTATTSGAVSKGAPAELVVKGTMRATFSPASNKLVCAELLFDTGSVASQAKNLTAHQLLPTSVDASAATAAQVAASEADALLDSIQMPQLATAPPTVVMSTVLSATSLDSAAAPESSAVSVTHSDKGESSSDESVDGTGKVLDGESNIATRISTRVQ